ncbi:MAG: C39 family peptidase [Anaerovoracaceae bacterium]
MKACLKKPLLLILTGILGLAMCFSLSFDTAAAAAAPKKINIKAQSSSRTVDLGAKLKLTIRTTPKHASAGARWSVTKGGKYASLTKKSGASTCIKGKRTGTASVRAVSTAGRQKTASIRIKVKNLKARSVSLPKSTNLALGKKTALKAKVKAPQKYGYKKQKTKWSSSNAKVVTVSKSGIITAKDYGTASIKAVNDGKSAVCRVTVPKTATLLGYVLAGSWSRNKIDTVPVADDAAVNVWNKDSGNYERGENTKAAVYGNFVQLQDTDADKTADIINVVKREDSTAKWDKDQVWKDGIGTAVEPAISDSTAKSTYDKEFRIPLGERLLSEFGLTDYCGINDFQDQENSPYWTDTNWFHMKSGTRSSSGTGLTMLTGYKTQPQNTGWSCVMASTASVLEWYGARGDLNQMDLATLRGSDMKTLAAGTTLKRLENVYKGLNDLGIGKWKYVDSNTKGYEDKLTDSSWIQQQLKEGHPIQVIWNSYGPHGQVIIGYDDMNTPDTTADDQLIMMDPYDTTDHLNDGYTVQSYERLEYGRLSFAGEYTGTRFLVAWPESGWSYTPQTDDAALTAADVSTNTLKGNVANKLNDKVYEKTAQDLENYYDADDIGYMNADGLGGAASVENEADYNHSPYCKFHDFFTGTGISDTLSLIKNFRTVQQSTEWTCGCASAEMVMEYYQKNGKKTTLETDASLSRIRQNGAVGATYLAGMKEMFDYMNKAHGQHWVTLSRNDMTDPDGDWSTIKGASGTEYALQGGSADNGLIPYFIDKGVPIMIGSDDWGGHWQVIIGYDGMGTDNTQDDVLIVADPYDTTDHDGDGYYVKPFERLVYGWNSTFERDGQGTEYNDFIVAVPNNKANEEVVKELGMK